MSCELFMTYKLHHGDCLQVLDEIDQTVDAIITDLPYNTTVLEWDEIIEIAPMWEKCDRVLSETGTFITTSAQPFTSVLVTSNLEWFKYEIIWLKTNPFNVLHAKNMPLKQHEDILVFSKGSVAHEGKSDRRMTYNPIKTPGKPYRKKMAENIYTGGRHGLERPNLKPITIINEGDRYPISVVKFANSNRKLPHPTQKPLSLYKYLVKTFTNPGDLVLDIAMGAGTTGVACVQTGRRFIGIEKDENYFNIAKGRIKKEVLNDKKA